MALALTAAVVAPADAQGAKSAKSKNTPRANASSGARLPASPPLPPPRPNSIGEASAKAKDTRRERADEKDKPGAAPQEKPDEATGVVKNDDEERAACHALLKERGALFSPASDVGEGGACEVQYPVTLSGLRLDDGRTVRLDSPVIVRCALAAELALWVRADLAPIMERHGMQLSEIEGVGGYACRNRNRQAATRISEHASGNAFDVHRLKASSGSVVEIMKDRDDARRPLRQDIRDSACERFPTVLGSGADAFHETHLHVDLRKRGGGFRLCNWDVQ